jgi:predicted phage terminase large subunit-like protein
VIKSTAQEDSALGRVETWVEQEPGSGGKESAEATIKNLAGHIVRADRVTGSKEVRAEPFAAQAEAGNVLLVRGDWNRPFVDELTVFPSGRYRDQVDAASGAFNKLALVGQVTTAPNPFYD